MPRTLGPYSVAISRSSIFGSNFGPDSNSYRAGRCLRRFVLRYLWGNDGLDGVVR